MSQSVKLKDGSYIDASGVWDNTQGKTQEDFNSSVQFIKGASYTGTTSANGTLVIPDMNTRLFYGTDNASHVFLRRGSNAFLVCDLSMNPVKNTEVNVNYYYFDKYAT